MNKKTTLNTPETSSHANAEELNKRVDLNVKLCETYIREFDENVKTKKDALIWCKSIPDELAKPVLFAFVCKRV